MSEKTLVERLRAAATAWAQNGDVEEAANLDALLLTVADVLEENARRLSTMDDNEGAALKRAKELEEENL